MADDKRFERAFEVNPHPMTLTTLREGRYIDVNDALLGVTGYAREEMIGRTSHELNVWVDAEHDRARLVAELSAHGVVRGMEVLMRMKDGEERSFILNAAVVEDPVEPLLMAVFQDVTDSRRMEQALRQSEERYREFIEDLPLGIIVTQNGVIKLSNAAMQQMSGYSAGELHGKPMLPHVFDEDRAWLMDFHQKRMRGEPALAVYDCRIVVKSGEVRHWNFAVSTVDWDGVAALTVATDVTDRYRMQEAIKRSEERYRKFIEDLPLGIVVTQQGTIKFANTALQELIGFSADELHDKPFVPFVFEADRAWLIDLHQRRMRGEAVPDGFECRLVTRAGAVRNWHLQTSTIDWDGTAAIAVVTDITEIKRAEAELRLAASVFDQASEAIVIADADTNIIAVNDAFVRLTGYKREEALGSTPRLLKSDRHSADFFAEMWRTLIEQGEWRGDLWNQRKDGSLFAVHETISRISDASGRTSHFVALFSDITDSKMHQQQLERMAHFDALTGLPNRTLLTDRLQLALAQAERSQELLAVCYLDLDEFKPINDRFGHEAGDRLLIEVAHRLKGCLRGGDTVARLGGDEFVLLLGGLTTVDECEAALERLLAVIAAPYVMAERSHVISASIGVALYPFDKSDADTLLRDADQAMYTAKRAGRNRYQLFDSEHDQSTRGHRSEVDGLRLALAKDELRLHYQPKVNMKSGTVIGVEALVRWQHPERGLLLPHAFLELAGESDLISHIGEWVIGEALRQCRAWLAAGLRLPVSVNVAASHLQRPDFVDSLARHLNVDAGAGDGMRGMLELEILESVALQDVGAAQEVIQRCRALGVSFALDDFGTGYSSLTYFRRLSAEVLKIDQSFVRDMLSDPEDLAIVDGVIRLTEAFQRTVIAEGVETPEHGLVLLQLGCDLAQGYGIALPMPGEDVAAWLRDWRPDPMWALATTRRIPREDFTLLAAPVAHRRWVEQLEAHVNAAVGTTVFPPPLDIKEFTFARWLNGPARERYDDAPALDGLIADHGELHQLGRHIVELTRQRRIDEARQSLPALRALHERVLGHLGTLLDNARTARER